MPSSVHQPFPRFYTPFLRGKLEFLADVPFKSIIFFCLGSSRAALLSLNNLFLIFLFIGSVRLIPHLFINKIAVFQPSYSIILFMEDFWPNYIIFSLRFIILFHNFAPLPGFPFIYSPISLYRLIFEVIWSSNSISCCSRYTPARLLSSVSASMPYLLPQVPFTPPGGFILINLPIRPPVYAPVGASGLVGN